MIYVEKDIYDDLLGDLLYTTALSYYAELDMMNHVQAKTMGIAYHRLPSEGAFYLKLSTESIFGIPRSVSPEGLTMDVARNTAIVKPLDGDNSKKLQFMTSAGMNSSALEHSVPEQLFSTPQNPAQGVSAVKALQIANDQGIPIYTIDQSNIATIFPQLQVDADVKADIRNAVNAGKQVTVSKTNIAFNGWIGCGYIIVDPITGAGAYMISGGMNGGWYYALWIVEFIFVVVVAAISGGFIIAGLASLIANLKPVIIGLISAVTKLMQFVSMKYLELSIWTAQFAIIRALYADIMAWSSLPNTSIWPIPTEPFQLGAFLWMLRNLLILELKKLASMHILHVELYIANNTRRLPKKNCISRKYFNRYDVAIKDSLVFKNSPRKHFYA